MKGLWTPNVQDRARPTPVDEDRLLRAIAAVDKMEEGHEFWVRDVLYRVLKAEGKALVVAPVGIGKATLKKVRRAIREKNHA